MQSADFGGFFIYRKTRWGTARGVSSLLPQYQPLTTLRTSFTILCLEATRLGYGCNRGDCAITRNVSSYSLVLHKGVSTMFLYFIAVWSPWR